ncbi:sterol desaturase family protein [Psychromonas sp. RZ22]|uniref:sterol desaturase family protein n=1 Tax=Psychromonas algarum TaxID=2555643 RepID=UPI0010678E64|nr:sterol desaturase family protein [Psychromonas sp. RZ22]TEW55025.1 sterol desaturase family protein [Psychromonas sp. RZ22]
MIDDTFIRLGVFFLVLVVMIGLEIRSPARQLPKSTKLPIVSKSKAQIIRLLGNYGITIISAVVARLLLPVGLVGVAVFSTDHDWGIFNLIPIPSWLTIILSLLLLDLLIYWQHRLFHEIPLLWKLHRVHHADPHVDSSTGLRFHPLEIVASLLIKALAIFMLGIPAVAVILFEVLLNGFAIFNHANIRLPHRIESVARRFIMTQILHRIHHSQRVDENNCNYGFSVIWWDHLFLSYTDKSTKLDSKIELGLAEYPDAKQNTHLLGLLMMPFKRNE